MAQPTIKYHKKLKAEDFPEEDRATIEDMNMYNHVGKVIDVIVGFTGSVNPDPDEPEYCGFKGRILAVEEGPEGYYKLTVDESDTAK
jgi:hypothetical protein